MTLPFTSPALLAPMEGVTEPAFRAFVLAANPADALGGTFTEFARVSRVPLSRARLARHLGAGSRVPLDAAARPVGLQLMGNDPELLAETARRAVEVGAPLVDLNFGCPAKRALKGCAGSALLDDPARIETLVRAVAEAIPHTPTTAKIRAGGEDDARLEEIARAVEAGGARLLTVHCRTRREGYRDTADWDRLARAVAAVTIPVCGNGGVEQHADLERLRRATGCAYVMVGRAALGDPWIFGGRSVGRETALAFLEGYRDALLANGMRQEGSAGRIKQLLVRWRAGGLVPDEATRTTLLRERRADDLWQRLGARPHQIGDSSPSPGGSNGEPKGEAPPVPLRSGEASSTALSR